MKNMLRIFTCGSVDDGKSTLIGHMLYEAGALKSDQKDSLLRESKNDKKNLDYSLLLDGLSSEREQGITIDVAHRYFETENRSFIIADTPGHEEYTRNMAVAASTSELALLLIDASRGVRVQTRRHLLICSMMGIRDFVFVVNKMDLVGFNRKVFENMSAEIMDMVGNIEYGSLAIIPVSALKGDNITACSERMPWYSTGDPSDGRSVWTGVPLLPYLESVIIEAPEEEGFVMPVQRVSLWEGRRWIQGNITSGECPRGLEIRVHPTGTKATLDSVAFAGEKNFADRYDQLRSPGPGDAVSLTVEEELDISRGHVLAAGTELCCSNMFQAEVLWMGEKPLIAGKNYLLKLTTQTVNAGIMSIRYEKEPETGSKRVCRRLEKNGIARVDIVCHENLVYDSFDRHKALGRFILIDKVSNGTVGCGIITHPLRRGENLRKSPDEMTRTDRENALGQKAMTIWFTGLSGSGKSTLAYELEKRLIREGLHTMSLDGDSIRLGINRDLGFNDYDRTENIRRVAEVSKLMNDAGIIVITSFISPFRDDREMARDIIGDENFIEVYLSTSQQECERRDPKGLYAKARSGHIPNFTGIGSPYEPPEDPQIILDTEGIEVEESIRALMGELHEMLQGGDGRGECYSVFEK